MLATLVSAALALGPFEKNHPSVSDGEAAFERGDYEGALKKFDEADQQLPNNAQIAFDRGVALHKLGRHDDARAAFMRASELNQGKQPLQSKIHYNLGNSWAATSNKKEAIAEYRKALRKDPNDEWARHNLEVILKDMPPPQQNNAPDGGSPDGGKSDGGRPDAGQDGGKPMDAGPPADGGAGDSGVGDGGADGGDGGSGQGDGGKGDGGQGDGGQGRGTGGSDGGGSGDERGDGGRDGGEGETDGGLGEAEAAEVGDGGEQMSKKDADRMLDAFKNSERNHPLWRFRVDPKDKRRRANEKDW